MVYEAVAADAPTEFDLKKGAQVDGIAYEPMTVPKLTITEEMLSQDRNSAGWKKLVADVADVCQNLGIFLLDYPTVTMEKQAELFKALKMLFDCPIEKKRLYKKENHRDGGYMGSNAFLPLYEAFAIYGEAWSEVKSLDRLMWPDGTDTFVGDTVNYINTAMKELNERLLELIFEGLGIPQYAEKNNEKIRLTLRVARYKAPPADYDQSIGLVPHVDKSALTFMYQNGVQGLEAKGPDGKWKEVPIPNGSMLVFLGDTFEVWSNGKYKGIEHRVVMKPGVERYSYTCFLMPYDESLLEVPTELVDEKHPLGYKSFTYGEYLQAMGAFTPGINTLEKFAAL